MDSDSPYIEILPQTNDGQTHCNTFSEGTSSLKSMLIFTARKTPFLRRHCFQLRLYVVDVFFLCPYPHSFFTRNIQDTSTKLSGIICRPPEQIKFEYHDSNSLLWLEKSKKPILDLDLDFECISIFVCIDCILTSRPTCL